MGVATGGKKAKKEAATKAGRSTSLPDGIVAFDPDVTEPATKAEFGQVIDIPIRNILVSPYQTRRPSKPEWRDELARSLRQDGQLTPCLVRSPSVDGTYELIAGHTRMEAAKSIEWTTLRCQVIECDDATARRLVLLENAKRKDLDPIEEALALKGLVDDYAARGLSQRQLANEIGVSQGQISNRVRLLQLPDAWKQRVISGEITPTQARELAPWAETPVVLAGLEEDWNADEWSRKEMLGDWSRAVKEQAWAASRTLADRDNIWAGRYPELGNTTYSGRFLDWDLLKPLKGDAAKIEQLKRDLDVREFELEGKKELRAFNIEAWKTLVCQQWDKADAAAKKKSSKATANAEASGADAEQLDPEEAKRKKKQLAEQYQRRLYRWYVSVLQTRVAEALRSVKVDQLMPLLAWLSVQGHGLNHRMQLGERLWGRSSEKQLTLLTSSKPADLQKEIREFLASGVSGTFEGYHPTIAPSELQLLADHLDIDVVQTWDELTADEWHAYLDLHTSDQLNALATELGVEGMIKGDFPKAPKRSELLEWLATGRGHKNKVARLTVCPKEIKTLNPISLT